MIHADPALFTPAAAPPSAPAPARALIEGQMAMLTRLAQMGMDIAEAVRRDACGDGPAEPAPQSSERRRDHGLIFARVARAVRMTIALQSRLAKDLADLDRADERAASWRRSKRRTRLADLVQEAAETLVTTRREAERAPGGPDWDEAEVEAEIEQMAHVAYERLVDAEDGDLMGRPFDEVVARICSDLGMPPERAARLMSAVEPPCAPAGGARADTQPGALAAPPQSADPDPPPLAPHLVWTGCDASPRAPP
jgi:hypothetical protein